MKQLSGMDANFLYMESPCTFGHVTGLLIFDRPTPDFDPLSTVYEAYGRLIGEIEPMRRRLVTVPFGLDHPYWIDDEHFDLSFHVRALSLAPPGLADQLCEQVARIHGRPMDRSRPLWEVYVIEGLQEDRWALLTKYHHSTLDGASGQIMLEMLTSPDPGAPMKGRNVVWHGEPVPASRDLLRAAVGRLIRNPAKLVRTELRLVRSVGAAAGLTSVSSVADRASKMVKRLVSPDPGQSRLPATVAPPTPWNKAITPHRRFAIRSASLPNVKRLKDATGGTVNDIVTAICAGGLRTYLLRHDALPDRPLRVMTPVSIRTGNEADPWTNRVSSMISDLPTDEPDPLERVRKSHEAMNEAKRLFQLIPADALADITQFAAPVLSTAAIRLTSRLGMADRVAAAAFNVTISNIPGPRVPLYFAGAQMLHQFPVSIVTDGQGLNITVQSYLDGLDFGIIADRELIPDLWDLADDLIDEISVLFEATGAQWATPPREPYPRRGAPGARPRQKVTTAKASAPVSTTSAKKASAKKSAPGR